MNLGDDFRMEGYREFSQTPGSRASKRLSSAEKLRQSSMPLNLGSASNRTSAKDSTSTSSTESATSTENTDQYIAKTSALSRLGKGVKGIFGGFLVFAGGAGMVSTKGVSLLSRAVNEIISFAATATGATLGGGIGLLLTPITAPILLISKALQEKKYMDQTDDGSAYAVISSVLLLSPIISAQSGYHIGKAASRVVPLAAGLTGSIIVLPNSICRQVSKMGSKLFSQKTRDEIQSFEKKMNVKIKQYEIGNTSEKMKRDLQALKAALTRSKNHLRESNIRF